MTWDRFDICEAWFVFASQYHLGQGSIEYQIFGRLDRLRFKARPSLSKKTLSSNARAILVRLICAQRNGDNPVRER